MSKIKLICSRKKAVTSTQTTQTYKSRENKLMSVPGFRIMYASPLSYAAIPSIQNACLSLRVIWNTKNVFCM